MESRQLRVLTGVGVGAVTAAAILAVVTDPKPAAAPLHPPVSQTTVSVTLPNNCKPPSASDAVRQDYARWRAAGTKAARAQYLSTLPSAERLQLQAYITALARSKTCSTSSSPSSAPIGAAASSVTGAGITTTSYVS